jgi:hypothetical protein
VSAAAYGAGGGAPPVPPSAATGGASEKSENLRRLSQKLQAATVAPEAARRATKELANQLAATALRNSPPQSPAANAADADATSSAFVGHGAASGGASVAAAGASVAPVFDNANLDRTGREATSADDTDGAATNPTTSTPVRHANTALPVFDHTSQQREAQHGDEMEEEEEERRQHEDGGWYTKAELDEFVGGRSPSLGRSPSRQFWRVQRRGGGVVRGTAVRQRWRNGHRRRND